MFYQILEVC